MITTSRSRISGRLRARSRSAMPRRNRRIGLVLARKRFDLVIVDQPVLAAGSVLIFSLAIALSAK
jgi:hypothetical protein